MLVAEMGGLKDNALHSYGTVFVIARLMHGYAGFQHNVSTRGRQHFVDTLFDLVWRS